MMAPDLTKRIDDALRRYKDPDPESIAKRMGRFLLEEERSALLVWALEQRIRQRIVCHRSSEIQAERTRIEEAARQRQEAADAQRRAGYLPRDAGKILWPEDDVLRELVGEDGSFAPTPSRGDAVHHMIVRDDNGRLLMQQPRIS